MTSSEVLEAPTIGIMPSASPISDFPNSFIEPEMLPFAYPSMSKRQGSTDSVLFTPVSSSPFVTDMSKTIVTNNTRLEMSDSRAHESLMNRVGYNPVQYLNTMTEHSLKSQFLTPPGLCQLMTQEKADGFYVHSDNNKTSNDMASDIIMGSTDSLVGSDHLPVSGIRQSEISGISSTNTRTYSSVSSTGSTSSSLVSCHGLDDAKVYTNLDSHKNNFGSSPISDDYNHRPPPHFPPSLSQSLSSPSTSLSSSSSISLSPTKSPSSSPSCMYVSHLTSSPTHSQLPLNMAPPETSRNLTNHITASCSNEVIFSHSYVFSEANNTVSNQNSTVRDSNRNEFPSENGDSYHSHIHKKSFHCESAVRLLGDDNDESSMTWTLKAPHYWSCGEVLDWLFHSAQEQGLDMQKLRAENFQGVTGHQLCQMDKEEFVRLEPTFGLVIHEMVEKMMAGGFPKTEVNCCYDSSTPSPVYSQTDTIQYETGVSQYDTGVPISTSQSFHETTPLFADIKQEEPCIYQEELPPQVQYFKQEHPQEQRDNSSMNYNPYNFDLGDPSSCVPPPISQGPIYPSNCCIYQGSYSTPHPHSSSVRPPYCYSAPPPTLSQTQLPRRKPGRPRVKNLIHTTKTSRDKKAKNQHLWEFIYEILMNPLYNPKYLRWENQREGVFRFVQSEAVAQLWGGRKNNENMTYEKLSRAMRHYYRRGILERVEGRRLVYKFSLKAIDRMKSKKANSQPTS